MTAVKQVYGITIDRLSWIVSWRIPIGYVFLKRRKSVFFVTEKREHFKKMVDMFMLNQSLYGLEAYTEILDNHSQKKVHQHEFDDQKEQYKVHSGSSSIAAITKN